MTDWRPMMDAGRKADAEVAVALTRVMAQVRYFKPVFAPSALPVLSMAVALLTSPEPPPDTQPPHE